MVILGFIGLLLVALITIAFDIGLIFLVIWFSWVMVAGVTDELFFLLKWLIRFICFPIVLCIGFFFARYPILVAYTATLWAVVGLASYYAHFFH